MHPIKPTPKAADIDLSIYKKNGQNSQHRGPYEAGAANRYYGARYRPNFAYYGHTFNEDEMTPEQIAEYTRGYDEETDRKQWSHES